MGGFTGNRHALLITEEGGKLVTTPFYKLNDNVQIRNIQALLDIEATLKVHVKSSYKAMQQDDLQMMINGLSKDKVKESLHEQLDFATYEINNFEYKEEKSAMPVIEESLEITVSNYATITGKRLFVNPNIMTRANRRLQTDTTRKYELEFRYEYRDIDTAEIELPIGYEPESMPKDISIRNKFGRSECSVMLLANKLIYCRLYEQYSGRIPATEYPDLVGFYDAVYKADRSKVVLVKKESTKGF
ncbi:MAG: hypothetical protein IPP43_10795 [Chitinophagaceae bacterium]|nr:hypothetical protein [Chitinophagaceae bacterium]